MPRSIRSSGASGQWSQRSGFRTLLPPSNDCSREDLADQVFKMPDLPAHPGGDELGSPTEASCCGPQRVGFTDTLSDLDRSLE
jgi:hypothetical protein